MTLPRTLSSLTALCAIAGCGGIGPGDYRVYRVAFEEPERTADCFDSGTVPVDEQDDSSSLFQSGTFVLYVGADGTFYLDTGTVTLRGTEEGEQSFTFTGSSTDVEVEGDEMDPTRTTSITDRTVTLEVEGEVVQGIFTRSTSFECEGPDCPDPAQSSCTETTPFVGGEVADVELEHEV